MAGHTRTQDTGQSRRTSQGRTRRVRHHLAPDDLDTARRRKQRNGARSVTDGRMARTSDPLARLDIARGYLRSAAAKYGDDQAVEEATAALLAAADRLYRTGRPRTRGRRTA